MLLFEEKILITSLFMESSALLHNFFCIVKYVGKPSVERSLHCKLCIEAQSKVAKNAIKQISEMANMFI